jgi:hypothetical protein
VTALGLAKVVAGAHSCSCWWCGEAVQSSKNEVKEDNNDLLGLWVQHFKNVTDVLIGSPGGPLRPEVQRQLASLSSVLSSVAFGMVHFTKQVINRFIHVFFDDFVQMFIAA